jgi:hypothetical protein
MWLNYDKNSPIFLSLQRSQPSRAAGIVVVDERHGVGSRWRSRWARRSRWRQAWGFDEPYGATVR